MDPYEIRIRSQNELRRNYFAGRNIFNNMNGTAFNNHVLEERVLLKCLNTDIG